MFEKKDVPVFAKEQKDNWQQLSKLDPSNNI